MKVNVYEFSKDTPGAFLHSWFSKGKYLYGAKNNKKELLHIKYKFYNLFYTEATQVLSLHIIFGI